MCVCACVCVAGVLSELRRMHVIWCVLAEAMGVKGVNELSLTFLLRCPSLSVGSGWQRSHVLWSEWLVAPGVSACQPIS